jgi:hypothetical protein
VSFALNRAQRPQHHLRHLSHRIATSTPDLLGRFGHRFRDRQHGVLSGPLHPGQELLIAAA